MTRPILRIALVLGLLSIPAFAAMIPFSPAEITAGAEVVVTGTVSSATSAWNSAHTAIFTDYTVSVSGVVKGTADRTIVVRVPGGEVEETGMVVEDQPMFRVGEQVSLNLVRSGAAYSLFGAIQGAPGAVDAPRRFYSYSGYHRSPASCNYYINAALPSGWSQAIQSGDAAWDGAGSAFRFFYEGTTTLSGTSYDGYNIVYSANLGSGGILAQNTYWYNRKTKHVLENDIVFNTYYPWATDGSSSAYDVQNIGTHEMGHCLVLNDLYNSYQSEMTMYGYGALGETKKRTLETGDREGAKSIYGAGVDAGPRPVNAGRVINN